MTDENHDVFSEESKTTSEADIGTETNVEATVDAKQEAETQVEAQPGAEESEQQGEQGAAPPAADGDSAVSQAEKMIPESRFKAAIKDVNDKLITAQREMAAMKAVPPPDRTKDPEGYDRHNRIEMSRTLVSRIYKDYYEKIAHFQEMVKANPSLGAIVANNEIPAQMAYDLAIKDMELTELYKLKDSADWKEFQTYKAAKGAGANAAAQGTVADTATQLGGSKAASVASKVPNLNRNAPSVNRDLGKTGDDNLFGDHYSTGF